MGCRVVGSHRCDRAELFPTSWMVEIPNTAAPALTMTDARPPFAVASLIALPHPTVTVVDAT